jgi:Na+-transporting NADH:ubiquinone oxidoreductase subunit NqrD
MMPLPGSKPLQEVQMSKTMAILKDNLWTNNPIFIQILGICSSLAVTNNLRNTAIMAIGVALPPPSPALPFRP